jgi:glutamine synthetase
MTTAQELTERIQGDEVSLLRFAYCDLAGITRCKAIHVSQLPDKLVSGVGLTRAQMAVNVLDELIDIEGMVPIGCAPLPD